MKHKTNFYRSLSRLTFSIGSILLIVGLLLGMFPQPVSATVSPDWDRSSLEFKGNCTGDCDVVKAKICNTGSGDMAGTTTYEVYWAASGNPMFGTSIATGSVPALKAGTCTFLTYDPKTNPNGSAGNYMFKAYQRPGHPGNGVLWSDECSIGQCSLPTATPVTPTATPITPTPFNNLRLTFMCGYVGDNYYLWRVRNTNSFAVNFTWDVYGGSESGSGSVPANSDGFFTTSTGSKTVRIFVNGILNDTKASGLPCKTDLELSYKCVDGGQMWMVTNPNDFPQSFSWSSSTGHSGSNNVNAKSSVTIFIPSTDAMTLTLTYSHAPFGTRSVSASSQSCPKPTPTPISPLSLSYSCADGGQLWQVANPNPFDVSYTWSSSTGASGSGIVPANDSDNFWIMGESGMIVTVTYDGGSVSATSQDCERPTEEPTETPTEEPTETPIVTETPSPTPTDEPTETVTPTETPTEEPTETPVVTETPSPTPTDQPTETVTPTETPTEEPTETPVVTETPSPTPTEELTETPVVTETPSPTPTEEPTETVTPTEKPTDTPPTKTITPVGTDDPGSPTPEITETVVTTPQPTSSGNDEDRDEQPPATLAPPSGGNTSLLIPVTGGDLSQPKPFGTTSLLLINFGLALLGFALILNGLGRR
ncbi:MAG: hypothetical protein AB1457_09275 [Chloroflexota bacterium]